MSTRTPTVTHHYYPATGLGFGDPALIREQLFLLAHDEERHLRPRLHLPALGVGLAGAAVIDLIITGRIHLDGLRAAISDRYDRHPAGDPVTDHVLHRIRTLRPVALHVLLRELGPDLYDRTVGALTAAGVLTQDRRWGRVRYELAQPPMAIRTRAKVRYLIDGRDQATIDAAALCSLIWALNMQDCLIFYLSRTDIDRLPDDITHQLPDLARTNPAVNGFPAVATAVRHAVGNLATAPF